MQNLFTYNLDISSTSSYRSYVLNILSSVNRDVERTLGERIVKICKMKPRVRRTLSDSHEVFKVRAYIIGLNISLKSPNNIDVPLRIASNTCIVCKGDRVHLYLRLSSLGSHPIPNPWCRTFIGLSEISLDKLHGRVKLEAHPILYPILSTERVEDPRVDPDFMKELFHVRSYYTYKPISGIDSFTLTFRSEIDDQGIPKSIEPVLFGNLNGEAFIIRDYRDTFPLNEKYMVTRPWIEDLGVGAIMIGPRDENIIELKELKGYPELAPITYERKTGGNCTVKISSNEYLLIFHGVEAYFGCYYTYVALLDSDGELLGVSPKPVISPRVKDYIGARPATIFVCGAQLVKDELIVSAGKDDEITLIMSAPLDKVIGEIKFIKG